MRIVAVAVPSTALTAFSERLFVRRRDTSRRPIRSIHLVVYAVFLFTAARIGLLAIAIVFAGSEVALNLIYGVAAARLSEMQLRELGPAYAPAVVYGLVLWAVAAAHLPAGRATLGWPLAVSAGAIFLGCALAFTALNISRGFEWPGVVGRAGLGDRASLLTIDAPLECAASAHEHVRRGRPGMSARERRLLLVLNEAEPGRHRGARWCGCNRRFGSSRCVEVVSMRSLGAPNSRDAEVAREIVELAGSVEPTIVIFTHTGRWPLDRDVIPSLRQAFPRASLGCWEGDWYAPFYKPAPAELLRTACLCHATFVPGAGWFSAEIARRGCPTVHYVPTLSDERFIDRPEPDRQDFDVVLMGGDYSSRIPFRSMPGSRERRSLVRRFEAEFGERFAVFGSGWRGPSAHGPMAFAGQADVYKRSRVVRTRPACRLLLL